jgi:pyridoxine kinase
MRRGHDSRRILLGRPVNLLSIQSHVAYGHVGNASAAFALQRLGIEVWPIHTVQFSNHTGYGAWRGRAFDGASIRELVEGIAERGVLGRCDGVLSGYMGTADVGASILDAVARVRAANPQAHYCCDPVIGDVGRGVFVQPGIAEFMRDAAVPAADIVTPNHFELDHLTGRTTARMADVVDAVAALRAMGPRTVLVTSLMIEDTPADIIELLACDDAGAWRLQTPRLPISVNGAGDAIAALFFAHRLTTGSSAEALSLAASSVFGILARTAAAGSREILLIEAQDELVRPSRVFRPEPA